MAITTIRWTLATQVLPVRKVADLNRLRALARARPGAASIVRALVVQPPNDETVDPVSARILMQGIRSPQKKLVMPGKFAARVYARARAGKGFPRSDRFCALGGQGILR